jgi:hypothetical protein
MPKHLVATVRVLLSAVVTSEFAKGGIDPPKHGRLRSVALADPPNRTWSANNAYWLAEELPYTSQPGPWTTAC